MPGEKTLGLHYIAKDKKLNLEEVISSVLKCLQWAHVEAPCQVRNLVPKFMKRYDTEKTNHYLSIS